ncbi:Site-specific recombinase XerD [Fictibacillus solisalsi]|uniref:Site-specific recombinase XerD n=1 Tax=Fictibacillus solisalsi TaxID=459525 RepID=A0A1G9ULN4_9BACL|nr:site-specific integrase [Fictibacillus solisalsi]SDM60852.1 Site-specific recombinase XerD [Fictibacillus solisalsi]
MASIEMIQKEFLAEKKYQGLTSNSLQSYIDFFKLWNDWLTQEGLERIDQLNSRNSKAFLMWCMEERGNKPKTVNTKLKLMRAFSKWLCEEQLIEIPFTKGVKAQREDDSPKILAEGDLRDVLRHLRRQHRREHSFTARRNYTLILFLAGTGLRLSELCSLNWNDINFEDSLITIRTSKSRRTQSVPLSDSLRAELLDYKHYLEKNFEKLPLSVFCTKEGRQLRKDSVQNVFKRLRTSVGLEGYFSPHTLRNFFIKGLLKGGANLRQAQLLARHSKIEITRQYVGYFSHELKDSLDETNPLRGLL